MTSSHCRLSSSNARSRSPGLTPRQLTGVQPEDFGWLPKHVVVVSYDELVVEVRRLGAFNVDGENAARVCDVRTNEEELER